MHAILVNPYDHTITDLDLPSFDFDELYKLLECELIEHLVVNGEMAILFDEEGRLKPQSDQSFFLVNTDRGKLDITGKALLVGSTWRSEDYTECPIDITQAQEIIEWI